MAKVIPFRTGTAASNWSRPTPRPFEVEPLRQHQRDAYQARAFPEHLNAWESQFLDSIVHEVNPSMRQRDTLRTICAKVARARFEEERRNG